MALPAGPAPKTTLPRESSIYTLTLDEFQNTLGEPGKSFGSMNMDEFLKNIWTAEESQAMAAAMGSMAAIDRQQSLSRQGSFTLPRTITKKTVDEVWREIHKDTDTAMDCSMMGEATRQATFGEITLEDFLVKAGVAREDIDPGGLQAQQGFAPFGSCLDVGFEDTRGSAACTVAEEKASASALPTLSLSPATASNAFTGQLAAAMDPATFKHAIPSHFRSPNTPQPVTPHSSAQQQQQGTDVAAMYANSAKPIGNGALPGSVIGSPEAMNGGPPPGRPFGPCFGVGFGTGFALAYDAIGPNDVSSLSPVPFGMHAHIRGRKRGFEGPLEKIVERRQRRMIKNRESASRSRARKQAYTVELEAEVTQLKQENMLLRRQQEETVQKKMQVFDMMAPLAQHLSSNIRVLRRSCTVPW